MGYLDYDGLGYYHGKVDELKANKDGSYSDMTVGNAEQLVATVGVEDKVPYNFRTAGGSADIGDREVDKIVGGTVAWNQMVSTSGYYNALVGVTPTVTGPRVTATGTLTSGSNYYFILTSEHKKAVAGHKYLASGLKKHVGMGVLFSVSNTSLVVIGRHENKDATVFAATESGDIYFNLNRGADLPDDIDIDVTPQLVDLTQMFGATIADHIYALEQANEGAGVAWFRKLFPKDYYAYDAGSLQSVQAKSHEMVGFNQWDEEIVSGYIGINNGKIERISDQGRISSKNYIPVVPNATYHYHGGGYGAFVAGCPIPDGNDASLIISSDSADFNFTIPDGIHYILFAPRAGYGGSYNNNICINLSWDGERNGEYEPYVKHSYPLDDSLTLRGIPKLDSNNNLYYDGDTYESDGTVTRKYGIVDLGTLTWTKSTSQFYTVGLQSLIRKPASNTDVVMVLSTKEMIPKSNNTVSGNAGTYETFVNNSGALLWYYPLDAYVDGTAFASAMSGTYMIYELATPTTESADPYQNPQIVDDFGTEEYVDAAVTASTPTRDVAIPVGHETTYGLNLRAKIETAPNSPDSNGDYIMRHNNGNNSYVLFTEVKELPDLPSEDGIYSLKCTVSDGTATLSWASD